MGLNNLNELSFETTQVESLSSESTLSQYFQVGNDQSISFFVAPGGNVNEDFPGAANGSSVVISQSGNFFGTGIPHTIQPSRHYTASGNPGDGDMSGTLVSNGTRAVEVTGVGGMIFRQTGHFRDSGASGPGSGQGFSITNLKGSAVDSRSHHLSGIQKMPNGHQTGQQPFTTNGWGGNIWSNNFPRIESNRSTAIIGNNGSTTMGLISGNYFPLSSTNFAPFGWSSLSARTEQSLSLGRKRLWTDPYLAFNGFDYGSSADVSENFEYLVVGCPQRHTQVDVNGGNDQVGFINCRFRSLTAANVNSFTRQRMVGWRDVGMFDRRFSSNDMAKLAAGNALYENHNVRGMGMAWLLSGDDTKDRFGSSVAINGNASELMYSRNPGNWNSSGTVSIFGGAHPVSPSKDCYTYMFTFSSMCCGLAASPRMAFNSGFGSSATQPLHSPYKILDQAPNHIGSWVRFGNDHENDPNNASFYGANYHDKSGVSSVTAVFDDYHNYGCIKIPQIGRNLRVAKHTSSSPSEFILIGNGRRMDQTTNPGNYGQSPVRVYKYTVRDGAGNSPTKNEAFYKSKVGGTRIGNAVSASFIQQGDDLNYGIPVAERSPNRGIAINREGNRVAFSYAIDSTASPAGIGKVRVYDRDLSNTSVAPSGWTQVGQTLIGDNEGDAFGYAMDFNDSGNVLVITALQSQSDSTYGYTKVFNYKDGSWQQIGDNIYGNSPGDNPVDVRMNGSGSRFIVGNDGTTMYSVTGTGTSRLYHSNDIVDES